MFSIVRPLSLQSYSVTQGEERVFCTKQTIFFKNEEKYDMKKTLFC